MRLLPGISFLLLITCLVGALGCSVRGASRNQVVAIGLRLAHWLPDRTDSVRFCRRMGV